MECGVTHAPLLHSVFTLSGLPQQIHCTIPICFMNINGITLLLAGRTKGGYARSSGTHGRGLSGIGRFYKVVDPVCPENLTEVIDLPKIVRQQKFLPVKNMNHKSPLFLIGDCHVASLLAMTAVVSDFPNSQHGTGLLPQYAAVLLYHSLQGLQPFWLPSKYGRSFWR